MRHSRAPLVATARAAPASRSCFCGHHSRASSRCASTVGGAEAFLAGDEWGALTASRALFPPVSAARVASLDIPVLMLSGGRSMEQARRIDAELERLLPDVERVVIPDASHVMCSEQPETCATAVAAFLEKHATGP